MSEVYYDRYDGDSEHKKMGYTRVLAKAGYVEQSAEFNEIQSIARDYITRLGDSLYREGYIVSGCGIHIDLNEKTVVIDEGRLYIEGLVRLVEKTEPPLVITAQGTERIVARVVTQVITPDMDRSLYDPAQQAENFGLPGADRLSQIVQIYVARGDDFGGGVEIYHLEDGILVNDDSNDDNSYLMDILAERTFDENGSYKVTGLQIKDIADFDAIQKLIRIYITAGKGYINGYSVTKSSMSTLLLNPSVGTRKIQGEQKDILPDISYEYHLSKGPVDSIDSFMYHVFVGGNRTYSDYTKAESKTHYISGGSEPLDQPNPVEIVRVYMVNSEGTILEVYESPRDYSLVDGYIDWKNPGGIYADDHKEPPLDRQYKVEYIYNLPAQRYRDFDVWNKDDNAYLKFLPDTYIAPPFPSGKMTIIYNYTLFRRDLILIDQLGQLSVIEGIPDEKKKLMTPYNGNDRLLALGYVDVYPLDSQTQQIVEGTADIVNFDSVRLTQQDFYTMLHRIDLLEDDMVTLDMEREIENEEDPMYLTGYFTDSFKNINRSDINYNVEVGGESISYTACVDYDLQEITTAADIRSKDLKRVSGGVIWGDEIMGTIIMAPFENDLAIKQKYATGTMLVNPYASYGPLCKIILTPEQDNWVDTSTTQVYDTEHKETYDYKTETYSHGWWSVKATKNLKEKNFLRSETTETTTKGDTTVSTGVTTSVATTLYEYMRPNTITVEGIAFLEETKNIYCIFNGRPVNMTPIKETIAGTPVEVNGVTVTTVDANENGHFDATIQVPDRNPCGTSEVVFTGIDEHDEEQTGRGYYTANGTMLATTITNTTVVEDHYSVLTVTHNLYKSDPLAQLFVLDNAYDRTLTKIGIYFATRSETRPAVLQVRNIVNGYPGEIVYSENTINPQDVNLPTDSLVPVVTEITLKQPVYCKKGTPYCFVILSDCNNYSVYIAEMGKNILGTTEQLVINPYGTGVLFSSSNAMTWTAHQDMDLKFELYRSKYSGGTGEIVFDDADITDVTGVLLDVAYEDNDNNGLDWYFKYLKSGGNPDLPQDYSEWIPIGTLTFRELNTLTNRIKLKAIFYTTYNTSPFIAADRVSLRAFLDKREADYIGRSVLENNFVDGAYEALKISYELCTNGIDGSSSGAGVFVYYQDVLPQGGNEEWILISEDDPYTTLEKRVVSQEFTKYIWNISKIHCMAIDPHRTEGSKFFRIRIHLYTSAAKPYNRPRVRKLAAIFKYGSN